MCRLSIPLALVGCLGGDHYRVPNCLFHQLLSQGAWAHDVPLHLSKRVAGSQPPDVQKQVQTNAPVLEQVATATES